MLGEPPICEEVSLEGRVQASTQLGACVCQQGPLCPSRPDAGESGRGQRGDLLREPHAVAGPPGTLTCHLRGACQGSSVTQTTHSAWALFSVPVGGPLGAAVPWEGRVVAANGTIRNLVIS